MKIWSSGVERAGAGRGVRLALAAVVGASMLTVGVLAWLWLQCWLARPYAVRTIFTRIERMSAGISALRASEEAHFQLHGTYSSDAVTLAASLEPGLSLEILDATETGYTAALRMPVAELLCDLRVDRNAPPPENLVFACRPCMLNRLESLIAQTDSLTLYAGETSLARALVSGAGAGCRGIMDTLYDWERISPPTFTSVDTTVVAILRRRGSEAEVYAQEPGTTTIAIAAAHLRAEAVVTVLPVEPVEPLVAISAGNPTCAVSRTGRMYCWGADDPPGVIDADIRGYCSGAGRTACSRVPRVVSRPFTWQSVAAGSGFVCGIGSGGGVLCWGRNDLGQVGDGTAEHRTVPTDIAVDGRFVSISASSRHACGVTTQYAVYCWGGNDAGQLGDGSTSDRGRPVMAQSDLQFRTVSAGLRHTCALTRDSAAYCWGSNEFLQIGAGDVGTCESESPAGAFACSPQPRAVLTDLTFSSISAGARHTCAITNNGDAYCWGTNASGEVGDGTRVARDTPTPVLGSLRFATVSAGSERTCAITVAGETFCWGFMPRLTGADNQNLSSDRSPIRVASDVAFITLDMGENHLCTLSENGRAYCWGRNYEGQLGNGMTDDADFPTPVAGQDELGGES